MCQHEGMTVRTPALVAISHGTSSEEGRAAVRGLRDAVEAALPGGPTVRLGHVDVEQPDVPATLGSLEPGEPAVIVPLLLSAGYHVHVDLTEAVEATDDRPVTLAGALGPDDRLIEVMRTRCAEAGVRDDDVLVLAVAGSSDARAVRDCHATAERFSAVLGREVRIGFLSAAAPRLADAIADARAAHPGARIVGRQLPARAGLLPGPDREGGGGCRHRPAAGRRAARARAARRRSCSTGTPRHPQPDQRPRRARLRTRPRAAFRLAGTDVPSRTALVAGQSGSSLHAARADLPPIPHRSAVKQCDAVWRSATLL